MNIPSSKANLWGGGLFCMGPPIVDFSNVMSTSLKTRALIIYRMYRYIVKLSHKRSTGNSAMPIEMAIWKYNLTVTMLPTHWASLNQALH